MRDKEISIAFVEFSNKLVDKERDVLDILNREHFYKKSADIGYIKTDDFTEFPQWTNYIASLFNKARKELIICRDIKDTISQLNDVTYDYVFFSAIESTRELISNIIKGLNNDYTKFIIGNGIGSHMRIRNSSKKNIFIYDTINEFANTHTISMTKLFPCSYTVMEENYNPRIYTTRGCKFNCKFCENDGKFYSMSISELRDQISITYPGNLIYVGNKTFLQGGKDELKSLRIFDNTKGFIVQTNPLTLLQNIDILHLLSSYNIKVVELGIESFDEDTLLSLGKPHVSIDDLTIIVRMLNSFGIKVIFNIMLGIPGDTNIGYRTTMAYLYGFRDLIFALNITNYSDYSSSNKIDRDERYLFNKSWVTNKDALSVFQQDIYKFNYELLNR